MATELFDFGFETEDFASPEELGEIAKPVEPVGRADVSAASAKMRQMVKNLQSGGDLGGSRIRWVVRHNGNPGAEGVVGARRRRPLSPTNRRNGTASVSPGRKTVGLEKLVAQEAPIVDEGDLDLSSEPDIDVDLVFNGRDEATGLDQYYDPVYDLDIDVEAPQWTEESAAMAAAVARFEDSKRTAVDKAIERLRGDGLETIYQACLESVGDNEIHQRGVYHLDETGESIEAAEEACLAEIADLSEEPIGDDVHVIQDQGLEYVRSIAVARELLRGEDDKYESTDKANISFIDRCLVYCRKLLPDKKWFKRPGRSFKRIWDGRRAA